MVCVEGFKGVLEGFKWCVLEGYKRCVRGL